MSSLTAFESCLSMDAIRLSRSRPSSTGDGAAGQESAVVRSTRVAYCTVALYLRHFTLHFLRGGELDVDLRFCHAAAHDFVMSGRFRRVFGTMAGPC